MKKLTLDREEREILEAIENGKWESVKPKKAELKHYADIARNTLRKTSPSDYVTARQINLLFRKVMNKKRLSEK